MDKEAMKMALEVNESIKGVLESVNALVAENKALKEALAKQEQGEPVATDDFFKTIADRNPNPFPTPQRTWVGLTDEEYVHITDSVFHQGHGLVAYYSAIEAKLKEKNT
jgi:hypothetical protein